MESKRKRNDHRGGVQRSDKEMAQGLCGVERVRPGAAAFHEGRCCLQSARKMRAMGTQYVVPLCLCVEVLQGADRRTDRRTDNGDKRTHAEAGLPPACLPARPRITQNGGKEKKR